MAKAAAFEALANRDFRLYFIGQVCSISGNNAQTVAAGWLVLQLTDSASVLGVIVAAQFLPLLLAAPLLGSIVDRFPKRTVLLSTQVAACGLAVALWLLTEMGTVTAAWILALTLGLGLVNALDNPTRQALIKEISGADMLPNAIALNNVLMGVARIAGPAFAGVIISATGISACFLFNALSFAVILVALLVMRCGRQSVALATTRSRSFRSGLQYVRRTREVRNGLIAIALIGVFTYEFWVTLPVLVKDTFNGSTVNYASLMTVMSVGSVAGGLLMAHHKVVSTRWRSLLGCAFGLTTIAVGLSPTLPVALITVLIMGAAYSAFVVVSNTALQLSTNDEFRGRVMGLWTSAFMGSTAIGGPLMGWIASETSARTALVLGGAVAVLVAYYINRSSPYSPKESEQAWQSTRS